MDFTRSEGLGGFSLAGDYSEAFYLHVFRMVAEGYKRLASSSSECSNSEEEDITGMLAEGVEGFLEDGRGPEWRSRYWVDEERPFSDGNRRGKRRRRLDIRFVQMARGEHPKFVFEAKRLNRKTQSVEHYFGKNGFGRFLSETYPTYNDRAGMLGYVQTEDESTWADRLQTHLAEKRNELAVEGEPPWRASVVTEDLPHTYSSRHRKTVGRASSLTVYHLLLRFC